MPTLTCSRCGTDITDLEVNGDELARITAMMGRRPLLLCEPCEQGRKRGEGAGAAAGRSRSVPEWPATWPQRAIRDLAVFRGEPLEKVRQLTACLDEGGTVAVLGARGRGKTVMATWLAQQRRLACRSPGVYVRAHDLFAMIRRAWHPTSQEDEWSVLQSYRTAPFLVVDEFQERSESDWENRTLVNILDHRHGAILPSVLIANLSGPDFMDSIGPSLTDRICQTGGIVECTWGNMR